MHIRRLAALVLLGGISLSPLPLLAATQPPQPAAPGPVVQGPSISTAVLPQGLSSCFDYYTYGSVPVTFTTDTLALAQGGTLKLSGYVTNQNLYPVDDVTVYAKIFYRKTAGKSAYGPDVVDWFPVAEHLTLKAGETRSLSASWVIPANAEPGNYEVAGFTVAHDRFNMDGLTFTNDIAGSLLRFSIVGDKTGEVSFDIAQATVAGSHTYGAAYPPHIPVSAENAYAVSGVVVNTSALPFVGKIDWKTYYWDGIRTGALLSESTTDLTVGAHASSTVSYTVHDSAHSVYYVVGELIPSNANYAKSYIGMRYVLAKDSSQPRLGYVGTNAYPGTTASQAFVCIHSTSDTPAHNSRVELSAAPLGLLSLIPGLNSLGSKTYTGDIPGAMSAFSFPLTHASNDFAVTAKLYQDGKLVDQVTANYSCKDLGSPCGTSPLMYLVLGVLLLIVLIVLGLWLLWKRRQTHLSSSGTGPDMTPRPPEISTPMASGDSNP